MFVKCFAFSSGVPLAAPVSCMLASPLCNHDRELHEFVEAIAWELEGTRKHQEGTRDHMTSDDTSSFTLPEIHWRQHERI